MGFASTPVRYGVVGIGMMGMEHIRNILCMNGATISCVADDFEESLDQCRAYFADEHPYLIGKVREFTDYTEMFKARLCDVCVIATPNHTHHDALMSAFTNGDPAMHILIEKPMCTTIAGCRAVIAAAAGRPGLTYVGLEYSYMPPVARVISNVRAGIIGRPRMVAIREHRFPFLIKVRNWNRFSCNTGGTFVEKCCHFFDLFNRILHPNIPCSVFASGAQDVNHLGETYNGESSDIMDNGYVVVDYRDGQRACLDLCMFAEASYAQEEVCIVGANGKLEAFLPQMEVRTGIRGHHTCGHVKVETVDDERIRYRGHHYGSSYLEHLDIFHQVLALRQAGTISQMPHPAGLYQGLLSVAIGIAAHRSIEQRRVVEILELLTEEELEICTSSV